MSKATCVFMFLFAAACAMGGSAAVDANQDGTAKYDAAHVTGDGSMTPHDAAVPHDAFVPKDAPMTSGGNEGDFCNDNTGCNAGLCCWVALCIPGTPIGTNLCIPN